MEWGGIDFLVRVCMSVGCAVGVSSVFKRVGKGKWVEELSVPV